MTNDNHTNSFASLLTKEEIQMIVDTLFFERLGELLVPLTEEQTRSLIYAMGNDDIDAFFLRI